MKYHILANMNITPDTVFTALAHPLRLRMLLLLYQEGELCVCELTHALGVSQPMLSRHLSQLRQNDVVTDRRQGPWVYYRLHDELPRWARHLLATTASAMASEMPYADDRATLAKMPNRPGAACSA